MSNRKLVIGYFFMNPLHKKPKHGYQFLMKIFPYSDQLLSSTLGPVMFLCQKGRGVLTYQVEVDKGDHIDLGYRLF